MPKDTLNKTGIDLLNEAVKRLNDEGYQIRLAFFRDSTQGTNWPGLIIADTSFENGVFVRKLPLDNNVVAFSEIL